MTNMPPIGNSGLQKSAECINCLAGQFQMIPALVFDTY